MITIIFGLPAIFSKGKYTQEARIWVILGTLFLDYLIFYYGK